MFVIKDGGHRLFEEDEETSRYVAQMLRELRTRGIDAVREYSRTFDDWDDHFNTNVRGGFFCAQSGWPSRAGSNPAGMLARWAGPSQAYQLILVSVVALPPRAITLWVGELTCTM